MPQPFELTAAEAARLIRRRELSPVELVEISRHRIEQTDAALNALPTRCFERQYPCGKEGLMMGLPK